MPPPDRNRQVYFVGADLSSAAGLPNTPSLIDAVLALAKQNRSSVTEDQLLRAFRFFYPDAVHVGFRPGVVDFFSTLRTFLDVGAGSWKQDSLMRLICIVLSRSPSRVPFLRARAI